MNKKILGCGVIAIVLVILWLTIIQVSPDGIGKLRLRHGSANAGSGEPNEAASVIAKLAPGELPVVTARLVQYAAHPAVESKLREDPPFRFSGDGTSGKVVSRSGQILMNSGEQIGIYGAEVGPDRIQVLVRGGNGVNFVINSATGGQVQLPISPPGANMLGFGSWYWVGHQRLLGVSGIQAHDAKEASSDHCDEPHASRTKLYVYDLMAKQLIEVALPAVEAVPVFAVTEVSHDGFVHLFADGQGDRDSQDLGWFQMN